MHEAVSVQGGIFNQHMDHCQTMMLAVALKAQKMLWVPSQDRDTYDVAFNQQRWHAMHASDIYDMASITSFASGSASVCCVTSTKILQLFSCLAFGLPHGLAEVKALSGYELPELEMNLFRFYFVDFDMMGMQLDMIYLARKVLYASRPIQLLMTLCKHTSRTRSVTVEHGLGCRRHPIHSFLSQYVNL
jgi:hypothetical protein